MVPDPHVAVASASASEVAIMLRVRNISVVPVVDDHRTRTFLGTLSDRDLVTRCLGAGLDPFTTRADAIMRTDACRVSLDQDLSGYTIASVADPSDSHLRATITVVDANHQVVGFISHPDVVAGIVLRRAIR